MLTGLLQAAQQMAESRMLDTAEIRYKTRATTTDPDTGSTVPVWATRFTTRCRVKLTGRTIAEAEVGGRTAQTVTRELHIPIDSPLHEPGDVAVVTQIHATTDPALLGAELTLGGLASGSQTTARRLEVTEVVS